MSEATLKNDFAGGHGPSRPFPFFWVAVLVSFAVHGIGLVWMTTTPPPKPVWQKPVEMVVVNVEPPKPPEPEPEEAPKPPPPKPPPIKVAKVAKPVEPPPPELKEAPPPPNDAPPPEPTKPVPLVVGISMSSTTSAGSFAAPVGNTVYGKTDTTAVAPSEVKSYSAPKYTPVYQVDSQPSLLSEVKAPYPDEARRAGIEGTVVLKITVDLEGKVVNARVIKGLGYGLDEASLQAIRKFKFRPAVKGGEAVSTEINYSYTWLLD